MTRTKRMEITGDLVVKTLRYAYATGGIERAQGLRDESGLELTDEELLAVCQKRSTIIGVSPTLELVDAIEMQTRSV